MIDIEIEQLENRAGNSPQKGGTEPFKGYFVNHRSVCRSVKTSLLGTGKGI